MRCCFKLSVTYLEMKKEGQRECYCDNLVWKESWMKPTELEHIWVIFYIGMLRPIRFNTLCDYSLQS